MNLFLEAALQWSLSGTATKSYNFMILNLTLTLTTLLTLMPTPIKLKHIFVSIHSYKKMIAKCPLDVPAAQSILTLQLAHLAEIAVLPQEQDSSQ
jgi:hypothetical protein